MLILIDAPPLACLAPSCTHSGHVLFPYSFLDCGPTKPWIPALKVYPSYPFKLSKKGLKFLKTIHEGVHASSNSMLSSSLYTHPFAPRFKPRFSLMLVKNFRASLAITTTWGGRARKPILNPQGRFFAVPPFYLNFAPIGLPSVAYGPCLALI